jgi:hypothetical protein
MEEALMNRTARERLADSEPLRTAVKVQLARGLLPRMGLPDLDLARGGHDELPDIDDDLVDQLDHIDPDIDTLEAIVQVVGRPPLLVQNDAVVFGDDEIDSLADFPPGPGCSRRARMPASARRRGSSLRWAASSSATSACRGAAPAG